MFFLRVLVFDFVYFFYFIEFIISRILLLVWLVKLFFEGYLIVIEDYKNVDCLYVFTWYVVWYINVIKIFMKFYLMKCSGGKIFCELFNLLLIFKM